MPSHKQTIVVSCVQLIASPPLPSISWARTGTRQFLKITRLCDGSRNPGCINATAFSRLSELTASHNSRGRNDLATHRSKPMSQRLHTAVKAITARPGASVVDAGLLQFRPSQRSIMINPSPTRPQSGPISPHRRVMVGERPQPCKHRSFNHRYGIVVALRGNASHSAIANKAKRHHRHRSP